MVLAARPALACQWQIDPMTSTTATELAGASHANSVLLYLTQDFSRQVQPAQRALRTKLPAFAGAAQPLQRLKGVLHHAITTQVAKPKIESGLGIPIRQGHQSGQPLVCLQVAAGALFRAGRASFSLRTTRCIANADGLRWRLSLGSTREQHQDQKPGFHVGINEMGNSGSLSNAVPIETTRRLNGTP